MNEWEKREYVVVVGFTYQVVVDGTYRHVSVVEAATDQEAAEEVIMGMKADEIQRLEFVKVTPLSEMRDARIPEVTITYPTD